MDSKKWRSNIDIFKESCEPFFFMREVFLDCNEACSKMFKLPVSEIVGRSPVEFSPVYQPDGTSSADKATIFIQSALAGKKQSFFWRHISFDGSVFDVEVVLTPIQSDTGPVIFGSFKDVTNRLRSEQMLAAAKERLSVTLKSIDEGVITTDVYGQTELVNTAALAILEKDASELVGRQITDILVFRPDHAPLLVSDPAREAIKLGRPFISPYPALLCVSESNSRLVKFGASPMRDNAGRIVGAVVTLRDVSETERLEKALLNTQRIESLGVLAGGIAHDFNNLLAGVFGYIEMAQRHLSVSNTKKAEASLINAMEAFDKARNLTQQLLTFSKGGEPVKKVLSVKKMLESAISFSMSGGIIKVEINIDSELLHIEADEAQIGQVFDNIIINAKQAMLGGGSLRIRAVNEKWVGKGMPCDGTYVKIVFEDSGPGIAPQLIGKIFDPFFTTKPNGNGLGLSTSYSIIKKHGGAIEVDRGELGGAMFTIWLPATTESSSKIVGSSMGSDGKLTGRVLIMDDESIVRDTLKDAFCSMGLECIAVDNGHHAVEHYRKNMDLGVPFDFVVLDLFIPGGMNGVDTLKKILLINPNANVVATSGYVDDPILAKPLHFGFKAALPKPSSTAEIQAVANMFCRQKKL